MQHLFPGALAGRTRRLRSSVQRRAGLRAAAAGGRPHLTPVVRQPLGEVQWQVVYILQLVLVLELLQ